MHTQLQRAAHASQPLLQPDVQLCCMWTHGFPFEPVAGKMDRMADVADVTLLEQALAPGTVVFRHDEPSYQHLDFTWWGLFL